MASEAEAAAAARLREMEEMLVYRPGCGYPCGGCGHHDMGHEPECWWALAEALVGERKWR